MGGNTIVVSAAHRPTLAEDRTDALLPAQDMSKKAPAEMLRLPPERPSEDGGGPVVEPSQQVCPHWALVVGHQAVREVVYMFNDLMKAMCSCVPKSVTPYEALSSGPKKVLFVRHGQGAHNRTPKNWGLVDPELTDVGEAQVADLHERLQAENLASVELIAVSPLTRAMQTATGGFAGCKVPYVVTPLLRERLGAPCDTGRTRTELLRCFPQIEAWEGMAELPECWWSTSTEFDLLDRVESLKAWLHARPEKVIAVVGHGGLFQRMLGFHLKNCGYQWKEI